jgi:hypothetical protein
MTSPGTFMICVLFGWSAMFIADARSEEPEGDRALADNGIVEAIWYSQQFDLDLFSHGTWYDCQGLARRLAIILHAVGARQDTHISMQCSSGLPQHLRLVVRMSTPVPASPENILAATTYTSTQRLTAQLRGEQLPQPGDLERFPAEWRTVSLAKIPKLELTDGDCSVLRHLSKEVFPKFAAQVVSSRFHCMPSPMRIRPVATPLLTVKTLVRRAA